MGGERNDMTHSRWILVGLLTALVLGGLVFDARQEARSRRVAQYRARAESYAWGEAGLLEQVAEKLRAARIAESSHPEGRAEAELLRAEAERLARLGAWHVKLEQKYAWAAEHPWEPLPPDPPPPDARPEPRD